MSTLKFSEASGALSRRLPHRWRRFLLDRLGLASVAGRFSENATTSFQLENGMSIFVNPILHSGLFKDGKLEYEADVFRFIKENVSSRDVFYDIGANVGLFTLISASLVGNDGHVYAFEPERNNLRCLENSLRQNACDNVTIVPCAAGAVDGVSPFDRRGGAFSGQLVNSGPRRSAGRIVDVEVRALDSCLSRAGFRPPTIIKIDVEGGEGDVLAGARSLLKTYRPTLIIEMHRHEAATPNDAIRLLSDAGYRVFALEEFVRNGTSATVLDRPRSGHVVALAGVADD